MALFSCQGKDILIFYGCTTNLWVGIDLSFFWSYYLNAI